MIFDKIAFGLSIKKIINTSATFYKFMSDQI